MGNEPQRQVFPEDFLHALATLETFRHLAAAGIDNELGLEVGTIRHLARLDAASSTQDSGKRKTDDLSCRVNSDHQGRGDSAVPDIEVNLDGKVPARCKFNADDVMFDVSTDVACVIVQSSPGCIFPLS